MTLVRDGLRLEVDGQVATVTLCRPETRNAQSPRMWAGLRAIGASLPGSVRVAVVRAEGESFSSGLDRRMFTRAGIPGEGSLEDIGRLDTTALDEVLSGYQDAFSWLRRADLITIAAVQGHAIGAGFPLALACDLRVLADDVRLAMRETTLGLVPDLGGIRRLVEAVGYARAVEICVTGRSVGADEAADHRLATIVVPRSSLDATVADLVAAVTVAPHRAVTATKALLLGAADTTHSEQLAAERAAQSERIRDLVEQAARNNCGDSRVDAVDE